MNKETCKGKRKSVSILNVGRVGETGRPSVNQNSEAFYKIYYRMEGCMILPVNESNSRDGKAVWPESGWDPLRLTSKYC